MVNFERRFLDYEGHFYKRAISQDISYWEIHKDRLLRRLFFSGVEYTTCKVC